MVGGVGVGGGAVVLVRGIDVGVVVVVGGIDVGVDAAQSIDELERQRITTTGSSQNL